MKPFPGLQWKWMNVMVGPSRGVNGEDDAAAGRAIVNAMTVDVEEHFQVSGFEGVVDRESWDRRPSRVEENTDRVLDLLDEAGVRATFFVLGWIAERHGSMIRSIADRGHEIGCHGYSHCLAYRQSSGEFRAETERARSALQDHSGQPVIGYRAASFSIRRENLHFLDILAEMGFEYDSSLFPVRHHRYGVPGGFRHIHRIATPSGRELIEVPPSTLKIAGQVVPVAGGGYLRLYPLSVTRWAIRRLNRREAMPAVVYIHPWELDPGQPRIAAPRLARWRHYVGLRGTAGKLRRLLAHHRFGSLREILAAGDWPHGQRP